MGNILLVLHVPIVLLNVKHAMLMVVSLVTMEPIYQGTLVKLVQRVAPRAMAPNVLPVAQDITNTAIVVFLLALQAIEFKELPVKLVTHPVLLVTTMFASLVTLE